MLFQNGICAAKATTNFGIILQNGAILGGGFNVTRHTLSQLACEVNLLWCLDLTTPCSGSGNETCQKSDKSSSQAGPIPCQIHSTMLRR